MPSDNAQWGQFGDLTWKGLTLHFQREHHPQELLVVDGDVAVPVFVLVPEGGSQCLQHHAELDEVVEDDPARVGAVELAQEQVDEVIAETVA